MLLHSLMTMPQLLRFVSSFCFMLGLSFCICFFFFIYKLLDTFSYFEESTSDCPLIYMSMVQFYAAVWKQLDCAIAQLCCVLCVHELSFILQCFQPIYSGVLSFQNKSLIVKLFSKIASSSLRTFFLFWL